MTNPFSNWLSPYMLLGVFLVLTPVFGIMTLERMEKQKAYIREQLLVKGISLIRTFEAGTRTGMLTMRWGVHRIQSMLQETSFQPDVEYIMITDKEGKILAHSEADRVGQVLDNMPVLLSRTEDPRFWAHRILDRDDGSLFEVYKRFMPFKSRWGGRHKKKHGMHMPDPGSDRHRDPGSDPEDPPPLTDQFIFVGLSMEEAKLAQAGLIKETVGRGLLFFVIGSAGIISLMAFQAYRSAKASLTSVKAFSDNVVQNMPSGLVTVDRKNRITSVNRAARDILGRDLDQPSPDMLAMIREMSGHGRALTREIAWDNGSDRNELKLDMTASPILDNDGHVEGFLFLFRDLTQIRQLKKEVETNRHLAAIGKLAAGVAHEIRNPLSSIKGFATYFGKRYRDSPNDRQTAEIMVQEVERINRSITQLLEFAKPMAVELKTADIGELVSHSLKLVEQDLAKQKISARVNVDPGRTRVQTDPDRMNQVLLNLYMNALAAMDAGGTLSVTAMASQDNLEILVKDDGCGMDPAVLSQIFDPYFTTRSDGTGLGLSIVHRIVRNLGGSIRAESEAGRGSRFIIRLPVGEPGTTPENTGENTQSDARTDKNDDNDAT